MSQCKRCMHLHNNICRSPKIAQIDEQGCSEFSPTETMRDVPKVRDYKAYWQERKCDLCEAIKESDDHKKNCEWALELVYITTLLDKLDQNLKEI